MEYMSQEGYDKLVEELRQMIQEELPRVKDAIAEARDKGDLSENFEYHAAKREQGRLLSRIRFKQKVLKFARVIDTSRLKADTIALLSKVVMTNLTTGAQMNYTIVSPHEADLRELCIGTINELYDGNPPFRGHGAISYAPSVEAVIRLYQGVQKMINKEEEV